MQDKPEKVYIEPVKPETLDNALAELRVAYAKLESILQGVKSFTDAIEANKVDKKPKT